jgi:hypothetical protein
MNAGIMVIFVAMVLVASTTFFAPAAPATTGSSAGKDPRVGVVLVILGCMAQGVQCEYLTSSSTEILPSFLTSSTALPSSAET